MVHTRTFFAVILSTVLLAGGLASASSFASSDAEIAGAGDLVEYLIAQKIIPEPFAERARAFARLFSLHDGSQGVTEDRASDVDKVRVSTSQLIDHANLEYAVGDEVSGLLLLVENTTSIDAVLEAKRGCQVVYRIFSGEELLFDSANTDRCKTEERVSYVLGPGKTRMFEISHASTTQALAAGTYRFELEYPGYGSGEKIVTIMER